MPKQLILQMPNARQKLFLAAKTKHIAYGGARGGGKSWAVRDKAKRLCLNFAGIKLLIVRRTYPELLNNHINALRSELIPSGVAKYNKTEKVFTFVNGSTIHFGYCAADKDLDQYQGAEYDCIFLDEATQLKQEWIQKITACVRGVNGFPKRVYYTCNPGGVSHGYIKRLFIDRKYESGEVAEDYGHERRAGGRAGKAISNPRGEHCVPQGSLPAGLWHGSEGWCKRSWTS